ncbi:MAG TPA: tRNA (N(6)-L-threonylcarbamoyladenosine(37)-C(2))-methylthiotransferase MtaB [Gammaproteobacteria bacterium]|nr:tRNA (N(6)-L-threonylcarbamoyladenosine(37)-C(2))-methylthiotransferase MtaB [Gammaproteobacteria bacterium]
MERRRLFATTTLGCKVNLYESEVIGQSLISDEWQQVDHSEKADLYVINTCTVTTEADRQARQTVRRLIRQNPQAKIVVTGCYAQIDPEACAAIPGVDLVLGNDRKLDLNQLLPEMSRGNLPPVMVGDLDEHVSLPSGIIDDCPGHTRAFVQVQQGCNQGCTFCIIHTARGPSRSFSVELVLRQIERLVGNGYREIVLCGVDIGSYGEGLENDDHGLAGLLREICALPGDFRIRISSIDPSYLDDGLIDVLAGEEKICRHFHLSLQSGSPVILKRMKRRYTAEQMLDRIGALSKAVTDVVYGADIMAGFPTETDAMFEDTLAMVHELQIAFPHVFSYSDRPGVPAARIPDQVPHALRKERARALKEAGDCVRDALYQRRLENAQIAEVILEQHDSQNPDWLTGRSNDYLPVVMRAEGREPGDLVRVRYHSVDGARLIAHPV